MSEKNIVTTTPFGKFVKKRLVDLEWTLEDLAKHSEISRTQLSRVLSGKLPLTQNIAEGLEEVLVPFTSAERDEFDELMCTSLVSVTIILSDYPSIEEKRVLFRFSKLARYMSRQQIFDIGKILEV